MAVFIKLCLYSVRSVFRVRAITKRPKNCSVTISNAYWRLKFLLIAVTWNRKPTQKVAHGAASVNVLRLLPRAWAPEGPPQKPAVRVLQRQTSNRRVLPEADRPDLACLAPGESPF